MLEFPFGNTKYLKLFVDSKIENERSRRSQPCSTMDHVCTGELIYLCRKEKPRFYVFTYQDLKYLACFEKIV